jgi:3-hydroxyisobutyrate dehydrogenase
LSAAQDEPATMTVAVVGCGEVGRLFAAAAHERYEVLLFDTVATPAAQALGEQLGVPLRTSLDDALGQADRVWTCVTGDQAVPLARSLAPLLRPGAIVVDLTTASSADKAEAAGVLSACEVGYVDVAIMGAVALTGLRTPLLATGGGAELVVEEFQAIGGIARDIPGKAGDAVALKLLRTVITKGLEALGVEALVAAERNGVRGELMRVLGDIDEQGFTSFLEAVVRTHVQHAERRLHEVLRAVAQLEDDGIDASVIAASRTRFDMTVHALAVQPPSEAATRDVDGAIAWLTETSPPFAAGARGTDDHDHAHAQEAR